MESDTFFWQLLKQLPETLFDLLNLPSSLASSYRFESVEMKKSYRLDGLLAPTKRDLPVYVVEVQFRPMKKFYANLFAKVFSYLEYNDPDQDWRALAVFESRKVEPRSQPGYTLLLASHHVHRIYLDELPRTEKATPGLRILQLVTAPKSETREIVADLLDQSKRESSRARGQAIVQLVEELLMRRFTELNRPEIRKMFQLHDLKESKVWKEAEQIGREEGREETNRSHVHRLLTDGKPVKEISRLLGIPLAEVRRLSRKK